MNNEAKKTIGDFEQALATSSRDKYSLRLYVAGMSTLSMRAVSNIKRICEEELEGQYELEVIDLYQRPGLVADEQIIAVPTLIKVLPQPLRHIIGDLSNREQVLVGLDLKKKT